MPTSALTMLSIGDISDNICIHTDLSLESHQRLPAQICYHGVKIMVIDDKYNLLILVPCESKWKSEVSKTGDR